MDKLTIKKQVAYAAVDALVKSGMKLGLGTGSTAINAVHRIAELFKKGKLNNLDIVVTSLQTKIECQRFNIPLTSLNYPFLNGILDLTIDGADEIDPDNSLIKGGGGALLLEKILAYSSDCLAIIADSSKLVTKLGKKFPVPVEVIPAAEFIVTKQLIALGAKVVLRLAEKMAGPVFTEHGNLLLDAKFPCIEDAKSLEREIKSIPGVVESGIFSCKINHIFIGHLNGKIEHKIF